MNYVESVRIDGFWGTRSVMINFRDDLNFLIGSNGSGKTTVINLLAATLRADIPYLYGAQFEKITVKLKTIRSNTKPTIEVVKTINESMGSFELQFQIREKTTADPTTFGVDGPFEERLYRDLRYQRSRRFREQGARLGSILEKLVESNWLSIHRANIEPETRSPREEYFASSVDVKLDEISKKFSTYFSLLASKADEESKIFQEKVFLSLLNQNAIGIGDLVAELSTKAEDKSAVIGVLNDLGVGQAKATRSANAHMRRLEDARKAWQNKEGIDIDGAIVLSDSRRVRDLITEWRELQLKRQEIFEPRSLFEEIINSLLSGKRIVFSERNLPTMKLDQDDSVPLQAMSSGEKQLFIILGEALLQEKRPVVFISDEPELSLHVGWQSSLFENIRKLNNSCQIISATHSPDIVGPFQDHVIQIEDCIVDVS